MPFYVSMFAGMSIYKNKNLHEIASSADSYGRGGRVKALAESSAKNAVKWSR